MAFAKNSTTTDRPVLKLTNMYISAPRQISESCIMFTLGGDGIQVYDMKLIDSAKGRFIASPQVKNPKGDYRDMFKVYLSKADAEKVIATVLANYAEDAKTADFKTRYAVE